MQLFKVGEWIDRDELFRKLVGMQYTRNDTALTRGTLPGPGARCSRSSPPTPSPPTGSRCSATRSSRSTHFDPLTGEVLDEIDHVSVWPATHYVDRGGDARARGRARSRRSWTSGSPSSRSSGKQLEAHRLRQRTAVRHRDAEGARLLLGDRELLADPRRPRRRARPPHTLIDYFPDDFVVFVDESHQTIPQIGGMYEGDRSRKQTLVDYGFRLPSAIDNRPLKFDEFLDAGRPDGDGLGDAGRRSSAPSPTRIVEQIVRPTGIVDPDGRGARDRATRSTT